MRQKSSLVIFMGLYPRKGDNSSILRIGYGFIQNGED